MRKNNKRTYGAKKDDKTPQKKVAVQNRIKIHNLIPEDDEHGCIGVTFEGYCEKSATDPLFHRKHPTNERYLKAVQPYGFCFEWTVQGVKQVKPGTTYARKIMLFGSENQDISTEAEVEEWVTQKLIPEIMKLGDLSEAQTPLYDPKTDYVEVAYWTDLLRVQDVLKVWKKDFFESNTPLSKYLDNSPERTYSIWPRDSIPGDVSNAYQILDNCLTETDKEKKQAWIDQEAIRLIEEEKLEAEEAEVS